MATTDPCRHRHPGGMSLRRWMLLLVVLTGLVAMHQLTGAAGLTGHRPAAAHATVAVTQQCPGHDGGCSDDPHRHPGQVCRSVKPSSNTGVGVPVLLPTPETALTAVAVVSPRTAVPTAAEGSGCGPPSLTALSISRT